MEDYSTPVPLPLPDPAPLRSPFGDPLPDEHFGDLSHTDLLRWLYRWGHRWPRQFLQMYGASLITEALNDLIGSPHDIDRIHEVTPAMVINDVRMRHGEASRARLEVPVDRGGGGEGIYEFS